MSDITNKLREARALIERGWTQGAFARGKGGRVVDFDGRSAVCFCSMGAIYRAGKGSVYAMMTAVEEGASTADVYDWNDAPERTQAEVLAAFDRAIELVGREA